jgi:serine palmitoyltransferase
MNGTIPLLADLHRLKKAFAFTVYCDEAHSFLSVGSNGRGCLEHWNDEHPDAILPNDLVDFRTSALSKAVGGLGGVVFGAARIEDAVRTRFEHLYKRGQESVSTSTIVQTLYILGQSQRIQRQIYRLRDITVFCKEEQRRLGVHVYGHATTAKLPVHAGRLSMACKLSYKLRQLGLLATPITISAVKFWESRVRVTLSADFSDDRVNKLLDCVVEASDCVGITKKAKLQ